MGSIFKKTTTEQVGEWNGREADAATVLDQQLEIISDLATADLDDEEIDGLVSDKNNWLGYMPEQLFTELCGHPEMLDWDLAQHTDYATAVYLKAKA